MARISDLHKKWNPTGRARGTIIVRLRQKTATARHPPRGHGFHLAETPLRLPPRLKPVVPGGGGWDLKDQAGYGEKTLLFYAFFLIMLIHWILPAFAECPVRKDGDAVGHSLWRRTMNARRVSAEALVYQKTCLPAPSVSVKVSSANRSAKEDMLRRVSPKL